MSRASANARDLARARPGRPAGPTSALRLLARRVGVGLLRRVAAVRLLLLVVVRVWRCRRRAVIRKLLRQRRRRPAGVAVVRLLHLRRRRAVALGRVAGLLGVAGLRLRG